MQLSQISLAITRLGGDLYSPAALFAAGEVGAWYDPSDYTTLFEDAAGTIPITTPLEKPVGLMLDKSKNGVGSNGAKRVNLLTKTEQFDDAAWIKLAGGNATVTVDSTGYTDPIGGNNARLVLETAINNEHYLYQAVTALGTQKFSVYVKPAGRTWIHINRYIATPLTPNRVWFNLSGEGSVGTNTNNLPASISRVPNTDWYLCSITATVASAANCSISTATADNTLSYAGDTSKGIYIWGADLRLASEATTLPTYQPITDTWYNTIPGNHAYQSASSASRPTLSARINAYVGTETLSTQNVTTLAANYTLSFTGTGSITLSGTATGTYSAGTHTITCTAGTLTSTVTGTVTKADLRVTNDALNQPAYQRVNTATDYDTVGFLPRLRVDGSDDWLVTNTITPGTDKAQVFAGVRKIGVTSTQMIAEFSADLNANNGSISILVSNVTDRGYAAVSRGTVVPTPAFYAPTTPNTETAVIATTSSIAEDSITLRRNGVAATPSTGDQGTGNYLAYPLYIGRRGGTTLPFNGFVYGLIVRFGPTLSDAQITSTERWMANKTGVTL